MSHYEFTSEDRARAAESRAANKAEKAAAAAPAFQVTADNMESVGYELLSQLYALAMTATDEGTRVRAASRALTHLLPSLRAIEHDFGSLDPININELETAANEARHGQVDPSEFSGPVDVPAETPLPSPEDERPPLKPLPEGVIIR